MRRMLELKKPNEKRRAVIGHSICKWKPAVGEEHISSDWVEKRRSYLSVARICCNTAIDPVELTRWVKSGHFRALADDRGSPVSDRDSDLPASRYVPSATKVRCSKIQAYSMTSSACVRNDSGIVRPSALAVLRLMISSNL